MVGGLTYTEQRTHFAFWCMLSSPLMLGNDPRHMSTATARILTAPGLLAINQDPLGTSARKLWHEGQVRPPTPSASLPPERAAFQTHRLRWAVV
jgi:hypothetical protein